LVAKGAAAAALKISHESAASYGRQKKGVDKDGLQAFKLEQQQQQQRQQQ
jgi:hypothetical protein